MIRIRTLPLVFIFMVSTTAGAEDSQWLPVVVSKDDVGGAIFEGVSSTTHADGHTTQDVTSLTSSDKKFASGMYRSGKTRYDVVDGYGVDEFMYFIEGGITLTSEDGTVQVVRAGEAVTVPQEWKGVFETEGYTKFWVICLT